MAANLHDGNYKAGFSFKEKFDNDERELFWHDELLYFTVHHKNDGEHIGYSFLPANITIGTIYEFEKTEILKNPIGMLSANIENKKMQTNRIISIPITIKNLSQIDWLKNSTSEINISYHWLYKNGDVETFDGLRSNISHMELSANSSIESIANIMTPKSKGEYILIITLVQEGAAWMENIGLIPSIHKISIH